MSHLVVDGMHVLWYWESLAISCDFRVRYEAPYTMRLVIMDCMTRQVSASASVLTGAYSLEEVGPPGYCCRDFGGKAIPEPV